MLKSTLEKKKQACEERAVETTEVAYPTMTQTKLASYLQMGLDNVSQNQRGRNSNAKG